MAVNAPDGVNITVRLLDARTQAMRSLSVPARLVVPTLMTGSTSGVGEMPTLIATERVIERINATGFAFSDDGGMHTIAELINRNFISIPSDEWKSTTLDLRASIMVTKEDQQVGRFVEAMRNPLLPGAVQYIGASRSRDPDAIPKLADALYVDTQKELTSQRNVWESLGPKIGRFVGRCALEGIVSTIFGAPVGFFLDSIFN